MATGSVAGLVVPVVDPLDGDADAAAVVLPCDDGDAGCARPVAPAPVAPELDAGVVADERAPDPDASCPLAAALAPEPSAVVEELFDAVPDDAGGAAADDCSEGDALEDVVPVEPEEPVAVSPDGAGDDAAGGCAVVADEPDAVDGDALEEVVPFEPELVTVELDVVVPADPDVAGGDALVDVVPVELEVLLPFKFELGAAPDDGDVGAGDGGVGAGDDDVVPGEGGVGVGDDDVVLGEGGVGAGDDDPLWAV